MYSMESGEGALLHTHTHIQAYLWYLWPLWFKALIDPKLRVTIGRSSFWVLSAAPLVHAAAFSGVGEEARASGESPCATGRWTPARSTGTSGAAHYIFISRSASVAALRLAGGPLWTAVPRLPLEQSKREAYDEDDREKHCDFVLAGDDGGGGGRFLGRDCGGGVASPQGEGRSQTVADRSRSRADGDNVGPPTTASTVLPPGADAAEDLGFFEARLSAKLEARCMRSPTSSRTHAGTTIAEHDSAGSRASTAASRRASGGSARSTPSSGRRRSASRLWSGNSSWLPATRCAGRRWMTSGTARRTCMSSDASPLPPLLSSSSLWS